MKKKQTKGKPSASTSAKKSSKKTSLPSDDYRYHIAKSPIKHQKRLMIGVPMTGLLRSEWVLARYGQIIPTNWSHVDFVQFFDSMSPIGYMVADARNYVVKKAVEMDMEWLLFIDHDVVLPPDAFVRLNDYMRKGDIPVVSGLYYTKSNPSEPLLYRGRGNSFYDKWELGDKVWVDGIPMGCTLIHMSILKEMWKRSEEYRVHNEILRRVFQTPNFQYFGEGNQGTEGGTEDLHWCTRVMKENFLQDFPQVAKKQYPFLVDTNLFCRHITNDGMKYPDVTLDGKYPPHGL